MISFVNTRVKIGEIENLKVFKGITNNQIEQLVHLSQTDNLVIQNTHDKERFKSIDSYHEFPPQGKTVYTLTNDQEKLCGIIWFHHMELPDKKYKFNINKELYTITFAIRTYNQARGKGYSYHFAKIAFEDFYKSEEYKKLGQKGFWLETYSWNKPAINTYKKCGFEEITDPDDNQRILLIASIQL